MFWGPTSPEWKLEGLVGSCIHCGWEFYTADALGVSYAGGGKLLGRHFTDPRSWNTLRKRKAA